MARIEELKESVAKAQERVEKCKGTIHKHQMAASKRLAVLALDGISQDNMAERYNNGTYEVRVAISGYESKLDDVKGATKKLKDAEGILAGWQAKLDKEVEKERFINNQAPQVIRDFLEAWKIRAFQWHVRKYEGFPAFKEKLRKEELAERVVFIEAHPELFERFLTNGKVPKDKREDWYFLHNVYPRKELDKHLKEQHLDHGSIKMREMDYAGHLVLRMADFRDDVQATTYLARELEREKQNKMIDLINRVNEVVGTITDAAGLRIDVKGNLNGIVVGKKAKAKVETIGAGGWNIQCFHFRTLVHEVKEKAAK